MPNAPKSMQPPEVKLTSSGLVNWSAFEHWAKFNVPIWNSAIHRCILVGIPEAHLKVIVYHLAIENRRMTAALIKHAEETGRPIYIPQ